MKDYDHLILWPDYFNSKLSRANGRKVSLNLAVDSPTLDELSEAVGRLHLDSELVKARHPKKQYIESGYVSVSKSKNKNILLKEVAKTLGSVRGMRRQKG